jgi:hypothetical protein
VAKLTKLNLLHQAALGNDVKALRKLVAGGAEIDAVAKKSPDPILVEACRYQFVTDATVSAILDLGAAPTTAALHEAVGEGRMAVVTRLLDAGADPNVPDEFGQTPLSTAVRWGKPDAAKLLLDRGARADVVNKKGQSLLDILDVAEISSGVKDRLRKLVGAALGGKKPVAPALAIAKDAPAEYAKFLAGDPAKHDGKNSSLLPENLVEHRIYFVAGGRVKGAGAAGLAPKKPYLLLAALAMGKELHASVLAVDARKPGVFLLGGGARATKIAGSIAALVASLS